MSTAFCSHTGHVPAFKPANVGLENRRWQKCKSIKSLAVQTWRRCRNTDCSNVEKRTRAAVNISAARDI